MTVYKLSTPISEENVRKLRLNDIVYISGTLVTARDVAHKRALDFQKEGKQLPINLEGLAIFHCGPIMKKDNGNWIVVAAGPTTSSRMEQFEAQFIKNFGIRVVIGKGGMGKKTVDVMKQYGAFYGAFTGGAAVLAADAITRVKGLEWSDLGMPESMWVLEVKNFGPLTVAIDAHGNNLFEIIQKKVDLKKQEIYKKLDLE